MNEFINEIADLSRQIYDYGRNNDKEVIAANANYYERAHRLPVLCIKILFINVIKNISNW